MSRTHLPGLNLGALFATIAASPITPPALSRGFRVVYADGSESATLASWEQAKHLKDREPDPKHCRIKKVGDWPAPR